MKTILIDAAKKTFTAELIQSVFGVALRKYELNRQRLNEDELFWLVPAKHARPCPACKQPRYVLAEFKVVISPADGSTAFLMSGERTIARVINLEV